jgi:hypothetical protein
MGKRSSLRTNLLDWNLDRQLNPYIPPTVLPKLPKPISWPLGYRSEPHKEPYTILQWPVTFLATVAALCLVGGIGAYAPGIAQYHPPVLIASLGASAILDFNAIASPLAQPRNSIIGNTLAALMGVSISKLFQLAPNNFFQNYEWVSGAVGCAVASLVMSITGTIHPPGGATAVLASVNAKVIAMGWVYVGIITLHSTLLVVVALIFNNVFRQYPMYWWVPGNVGWKLKEEWGQEEEEEKGGNEEKQGKDEEEGGATSDTSSDRTLRRELSNRVEFVDGQDVHVRPYMIQLPHHATLSDEEVMVLERIQERLRKRNEVR